MNNFSLTFFFFKGEKKGAAPMFIKKMCFACKHAAVQRFQSRHQMKDPSVCYFYLNFE